MKWLIVLTVIFPWINADAQKNDTIQKYLDQKLVLTSKAKGVYPALGIKTSDAWFLKAMYPDTTVLLTAYFKDKNFRIKNGPYQLYHGRNIKAMSGSYVDNLPQGVWRYYYSNGQIKDSGMLVNNIMCGTWRSWNEKGRLIISVDYKKMPDRSAQTPDGRQVKAPVKKSPTVLPEMSPVPGTRDGLALTYHANGQMQDSGAYSEDKRTGLWKIWYANGQQDAIGSFNRDSLEGNWTYYRENGNKSTEERYKNGKLQEMTCYDSAGNKAGNYCSILKPPVALGPFDEFSEYMLDNVFWPKGLEGSDVQGKVKVQFVITKNGDLTNFKILESPHQLLSDEVTRFFSTIEKWSPAVSHNRTIDFQMQMEVPFYR